MTIEEIREGIWRMRCDNAGLWETCCSLADMPYHDGFDAACAGALDLIDGRAGAVDGKDI